MLLTDKEKLAIYQDVVIADFSQIVRIKRYRLNIIIIKTRSVTKEIGTFQINWTFFRVLASTAAM